MATKNLTNVTNATIGLSNAELENELARELPEREEMSGFSRWFHHSCYHPCYEYSPCYDYCYGFSESDTVVTQVTTVTDVFSY